MEYLSNLGCQIVDTTCPWVSKVWNSVDKHKRANCTSVIHGKWNHEETIATASFSEKYIIVLNIEQAQYVCKYILYGGDKNEFISKFKYAISSGFDPDTDLEAVELCNQTTMLKNETNAVAKLFEETMLKKWWEDSNSSNTSHLQEIAERKGIPSYYIDGPERIGPQNRIVFRSSSSQELIEKENFLKQGPVTVGVTSGASTPDKIVEDVLERVFMIHKLYCNT
ncbi:4-hydroxy-3-methylbut-2-enyl diphosphate reductase [Galdieria sulphuraria]|nr:4-hydroxy-3-methylbut-2-enyl diphosphate reductase [Galdieria sulphuraria]